MDRARDDEPRGWRLQAAIAGAGILVGSFDLGAISVAFAPLRAAWHLNDGVVTTLGTATLVGMLIGSLVTGLVADRFRRRRVVVIDVALFVASAALGATAPDFGVLAAARLGTGIAIGMDFAVVFPFIAETAPRRRSARAMAWTMWAANFGTLGAYGVGALALHLDPRSGWRVTLGLGAVLAVPLLAARRRLGEPGTWSVARLPTVKSILRGAGGRSLRRPLALSSVATLCYQVGDQGLGLVLPLLLTTVLASSAATGATEAAVVKMVTIPAATLTVVAIDRWGSRRLQVTGFLGRGLTLVVLGALLVAAGHPSAWLVAALLAAGYFFGAAGPDKTTVIVPADLSPSQVRATTQGVSQAAGRLGGIIGVTAYGALADVASPGAGLVLFGAAALVGGAVSMLPALGAPVGRTPSSGRRRAVGTNCPAAATAVRRGDPNAAH